VKELKKRAEKLYKECKALRKQMEDVGELRKKAMERLGSLEEKMKQFESVFTRKDRYEFLEHTADQYIRAFGKTLEEAFENGGLALFDTMTDITKVHPLEYAKILISREDHDLQALLYDFIEELLVKWELTNILFSDIKVQIKKTKKGYEVFAQLKGEEFDNQKHEQKVGVKAMTYCLMRIDNTPPNVIIEFVVDI